MSPRTLTLTIDLDGLDVYAGVHGRKLHTAPCFAYATPLKRFLQLADEFGAATTLFCVGRDLKSLNASDAANLKRAVCAGHEAASHSVDHDFAMHQRDGASVAAWVAHAVAAHEVFFDQAPAGFRAPGYGLSPQLLDALEAADLAYDSSCFPSQVYQRAKHAVLRFYRLVGRSTTATRIDPRLLGAPSSPYLPAHHPAGCGRRRLVELPIAPGRSGVPLTGTTMGLFPRALSLWLAEPWHEQEHIVLNFHAIDFAERCEVPAAIATCEASVAVDLNLRLTRMRALITRVARGRCLLSCAELATRLSATRKSKAS